MRTKRHCRPANWLSGGAGSCASTAGCSPGSNVSSVSSPAPTTASLSRLVMGTSWTAVHELEQQLLRALVAGGNLERRKRMLLGVGLPAALVVALRQIGVGRSAVDGVQRDDGTELAR